jgi:hypothetical protein
MDVNYLLAREQVSILRASTAQHSSARFAHRALARQYGLLLAESTYPHRIPDEPATDRASALALSVWGNEGGALP